METSEYLNIIEDAKKYFFAEDIVSYFMISSSLTPNFRLSITPQCFRLIPRAFNDIVETAACYLYSRISVFNTFRSFEANGMTNSGSFLLFASRLENRYFYDGYNPQKFLYFCAQLAYMAVSFYKAGKSSVPTLAVCYIARAMKLRDLLDSAFWNSLSIAALRYAKIAFVCGFVKKSEFESMKIQFVVNRPLEEHIAEDNNGIVEGMITNAELIKDLLKLSAELKIKLLMIENHSFFNLNNQSVPEFENRPTLDEDDFDLELSSGHSSTDPKQSLKMEVEETSTHDNKLDKKCTNPPIIATKLEENNSLPQKYRVFQVLSRLVNKPPACASPETCDCIFNANPDFVSEDMQSSAMATEASRSLKRECNLTPIKSDTTERIEKPSDKSKDEKQSSTTVVQDQKVSPSISGAKCDESFSENGSNENSLSPSGQKSAMSGIFEDFLNTEEFDTENCALKTVNFDLNDKFVVDIGLMSAPDIELFGETHESFLSNEDNFNSTFDILSAAHYMATNIDDEYLDISNVP